MKILSLLLFTLSQIAFAEQVIEPGEEKITFNGEDLSGRFEQSFVVKYSIANYQMITKFKTVRSRVCTDEATTPTGETPQWSAFYRASYPIKAQALMLAITGIDLITAKKLVELDVFSIQPKTWDEFKQIIKISDKVIHSVDLYDEVIIKNKASNKTKLGYTPDTETDCRDIDEVVSYRERILISRTELKSPKVKLVVLGALLLDGESEQLNVGFDGKMFSLEVRGSYNKFDPNYQTTVNHQTGETFIQVKAQRVRVNPANSLSVKLKLQNGKIAVVVNDSNFGKKIFNGSVKTVTLVARLDRKFWKSNQKLNTLTVPLNGSSAQTSVSDLGVEIKAGDQILVDYTLSVTNNPYYEGMSVSNREKIKLD